MAVRSQVQWANVKVLLCSLIPCNEASMADSCRLYCVNLLLGRTGTAHSVPSQPHASCAQGACDSMNTGNFRFDPWLEKTKESQGIPYIPPWKGERYPFRHSLSSMEEMHSNMIGKNKFGDLFFMLSSPNTISGFLHFTLQKHSRVSEKEITVIKNA